MSDRIDVAILGAGPYGLSIAAHLAQRGLSFRIFGKPMQSWLQMPCGMTLKSEGFASSLYDPEGALPLGRYSQERGLSTPISGFLCRSRRSASMVSRLSEGSSRPWRSIWSGD